MILISILCVYGSLASDFKIIVTDILTLRADVLFSEYAY